MTWPTRIAAAATLALGLSAPAAAGEVRLEIRNGLVTLDAREATVREILTEWARVGQIVVINLERVPGGPMTLQLEAVPERKALETLLRSIAGYVAAPRAAVQVAASIFERIMLMPSVRPAAVASGPGPSMPNRQAFQPQFPRERNPQPPDVIVDDQDEPLPNAQMPLPGQATGAPQPGMPTPNPYAQPNQQGAPANPYANPYAPQQPATGTAPGMKTPTPQSAPQPGMPTAPPAATRPGVPTGPIKEPGTGREIR